MIGSWRECMQMGSERLRSAGIANPGEEAFRLLLLALGISRENFWLRMPAMDEGARARHRELVNRRCQQEPFAYLAGEKEFMGLSLRVSPAVLIPRPETELLVEAVLHRIPSTTLTIWDVGTGSGAIALALKYWGPPAWQVVGMDVSTDALSVARGNAHRLGLEVGWRHSDLLSRMEGMADVVVANMPYIDRRGVPIDPEVRFEPESALYAADRGLALIARLIGQTRRRLRRQGWIALEVGVGQAARVGRLLSTAHFSDLEWRRDLNGIVRVVSARWER